MKKRSAASFSPNVAFQQFLGRLDIEHTIFPFSQVWEIFETVIVRKGALLQCKYGANHDDHTLQEGHTPHRSEIS